MPIRSGTDGATPVVHIREGLAHDQLLELIDRTDHLPILCWAASVDDAGPGPLISALSSKLIGRLRVPLTIVPAA